MFGKKTTGILEVFVITRRIKSQQILKQCSTGVFTLTNQILFCFKKTLLNDNNVVVWIVYVVVEKLETNWYLVVNGGL